MWKYAFSTDIFTLSLLLILSLDLFFHFVWTAWKCHTLGKLRLSLTRRYADNIVDIFIMAVFFRIITIQCVDLHNVITIWMCAHSGVTLKHSDYIFVVNLKLLLKIRDIHSKESFQKRNILTTNYTVICSWWTLCYLETYVWDFLVILKHSLQNCSNNHVSSVLHA